MATQIEGRRLATVKQLPKIYPAFTESSLRWLIFNGKKNGFSKCLRRIGRKVLIDLDAFEAFVDAHQGGVN